MVNQAIFAADGHGNKAVGERTRGIIPAGDNLRAADADKAIFPVALDLCEAVCKAGGFAEEIVLVGGDGFPSLVDKGAFAVQHDLHKPFGEVADLVTGKVAQQLFASFADQVPSSVPHNGRVTVLEV